MLKIHILMSYTECRMDQSVEKYGLTASPPETAEPSLEEFQNQIEAQIRGLDHQRQQGLISPEQYFQAIARIPTELERRRREAEAKAIDASIDELTGLPLRKLFTPAYEALFFTMRREKKPFSVLIIDVNGLKETNDRFGHKMGDQRLQETATALKMGARRKEDRLARLGGDEFAVVLPDADIDAAVKVALRVIEDYNSKQEVNNGIKTSLSIGIASMNKEDNPTSLLVTADQAMYQAKALSHAENQLFGAGGLKVEDIQGNVFFYSQNQFHNVNAVAPRSQSQTT